MKTAIVLRAFLLASIVALMTLAFAGCGIVSNTPATQPVVLTAAQQQQIAFVQGLQQDADLANAAFQAVALADPALAADALIANKADQAVDTLVAQYVSDVTAGGVPPATLLAQIEADVAQVLTSNSKSPAAAARYASAKAAVLRAKALRR